MEEIYLTVKEVAELKGCTERYVRTLIEKDRLTAETIEIKCQGPGRGGIQYRIPLTSLESKHQLKYKRFLKKQENTILDEPEPVMIQTDAETLTESERQEVIMWKKLLEEWHSYRALGEGSKEELDNSFISVVNSQKPNLKLTRVTLYRKWRAFKAGGEHALIDKRGKHSNHFKKLTDEVWDVFEFYYLHPNQKSIKLCMTTTELYFETQGRTDLLPLPSKTTFERGVRSIPIPYVKYFRENEKTFIGECAPYIKRMYADLESNDIWVADNHTFDVMINKNDSPVRVYLTAFMDVRSRKMMGWCVTDAPSSDATIYALKRGCEFHGVPKALYTDNGREFLFHDLGGNGFRKKKKDEELKLLSILDDLGIGFKTALPRNARAKGIERAFCTVKETFSKLYEGYTGGTILEKPDSLKQLVKEPDKLTAITEFTKQVDIYIQGWYNKQSHTGEGMNGKCPDEVFAENLVEKRTIQKDKLNLMFMRYAKGNKGTIKVGKNGISLKFYGKELQYWNEELWKLYFGRDVYVRYSPDDLNSVRVYNEDRKYICTAEIKTELSYKASKEEIRQGQQNSRSAVKAVKAYKKQKGIEADNELTLILEKAKENMGNMEELNPKIIKPILTVEGEPIKKAVGDYEEPIDWRAAVERLKKAKGV